MRWLHVALVMPRIDVLLVEAKPKKPKIVSFAGEFYSIIRIEPDARSKVLK